jgi:glutathione S-transferase
MSDSVHIFGPQFSTFVRSVQLCCEEKGISSTVGAHIDGQRVEFHGPEHQALHPFGKVPVLLHGERRLIDIHHG